MPARCVVLYGGNTGKVRVISHGWPALRDSTRGGKRVLILSIFARFFVLLV